MKKIIVILTIAFCSTLIYAENEKTKVCVDVKDKEGNVIINPKTKAPKQQCKKMKVHKKLEDTNIPGKK